MGSEPGYLLDTNMLSYIASGRSEMARSRMKEVQGRSALMLSAISEGELRYGLARKPEALRLQKGVLELLSWLSIVAWDSEAAQAFAVLKNGLVRQGKVLSVMDALIAAHALSTGAILVTHDMAFGQVPGLRGLEDWATDL